MRALVDIKVAPELAAFDNLAALNEFEKPLLVLVGSRDAETPPALSTRLFDAAKTTRKKLVAAEGKGHLDAMTADESVAAYREFFAGLD